MSFTLQRMTWFLHMDYSLLGSLFLFDSSSFPVWFWFYFALSSINNRHWETHELVKLTRGKAPVVDKERCGWKAPCKYSIGMIRYSRKRKYGMKDHVKGMEVRHNSLRTQSLHSYIPTYLSSTRLLCHIYTIYICRKIDKEDWDWKMRIIVQIFITGMNHL